MALAAASDVAAAADSLVVLDSQLQVMYPEEMRDHLQCGTTLGDLMKGKRMQDVHYANGDSDSESIRDQDAGPGLQRWHRRAPYFYRREVALEGGHLFRRRMKLRRFLTAEESAQIDTTADPGSLRPIPDDLEIWEPEAYSDDDGYVQQKSFVEKAELVVDDLTGEVKGRVPTEPSVEADAASMVPAWRVTQKAIEFRIQAPPTSAEPDVAPR